jgi:hypothetical protein
LEQKLFAKYQCDLAQHLQKKSRIEAKFLLEKSTLESNLALADGSTFDTKLRSQHILDKNAALMKEIKSLQEANSSLVEANTSALAEVVQEKQRIRKQVLALDAKQARTSNRTYVQSLEDCTKDHMTKGAHRKYQAEMLATTSPTGAYGGLCGSLLQALVADEIKQRILTEMLWRCAGCWIIWRVL